MKTRFDLPADVIEKSIKRLSEQSGVDVLLPAKNIARGLQTKPVSGDFTPREALEHMLADTGLVVEQDAKSGALTVRKETATESKNVVSRPVVDRAAGADEVLQLAPFTVESSQNIGYQARSTLAGTRINTKLDDVASSIQVVTKEFLQDTSASNLEDLLVYTTGTETAGLGGNFTSADGSGPVLRTERVQARPQEATRVRGLSRADLTQNYFLSDIPPDAFNIESVTISRGPNSALFGLGSPGGIIESSLKRASLYKNATEIQHKVTNFGSNRGTLDHNQVLVPEMLAVRIAALAEREQFEQETTFVKQRRFYADLEFQPFRNTQFRANVTQGEVRANRPKLLPPVDRISGWWALNKAEWNPLTSQLTDAAWQGNTANTTRLIQNGLNGAVGNLTAVFDQHDQNIGSGLNGFVPVWTRSFDSALTRDVNLMSVSDSLVLFRDQQTVPTEVAAYYVAKRISDRSIFDFRKYNIDGPNKAENQDFNTINLSLSQTAFENTLGFEVAYNRQNYWDDFWTNSSSAGSDSIGVDINRTLQNGQPNPNFGRAFTGGSGFAEGYDIDRESVRLTAFAVHDFTEQKGALAWLGRHVLTGLYEDQTREKLIRTYFDVTATSQLNAHTGRSDNLASAQMRGAQITYLGASLANATTLSGANIPGILVFQDPRILSNALLWNRTTKTFTSQTIQMNARFDNPDAVFTSIATGQRENFKSAAGVLQSFLLKNHLVTTVSWRDDRVEQYTGLSARNTTTGLSVLPVNFSSTPLVDTGSSVWSYGGVLHAPEQWLPQGVGLTAHFNKSSNFTAVAGKNLFNESQPFQEGNTEEYGFSVELFDRKLSARVNFFKTTQLNELITFPGTGVMRATLEGVYQWNTPQAIASSGWTPWPDEVITAWQGVRSGTFPNGNPQWTLQNPTTAGVYETRDYETKGMELELVYNPTANWRIILNAAKTEAVTANSAPGLQRFIEQQQAQWNNPAIGGTLYAADPALGEISRLKNVAYTVANNNLYSAQARDGGVSTELRKWRWNLVTNYQFSREGWLKGFGLGGAVRWQDRVAIGYPITYDSTKALWLPDVSNPIMGPTELNVDGWLTYQRKLRGGKLTWVARLGVKNLGAGKGMIPIKANPDGEVVESRIAEPTIWELSNTFKF